MEGSRSICDPTKHHDDGLWRQWQAGTQLLRQIQDDYRQARRHLEELSSLFDDRENEARQQLETMLERTQSDDRLGHNVVLCLQTYCLGSFEVRLDNSRVDQWSSLKAKSVLKYLLAQRGRPVPRDVLMETLWSGWCSELAGSNLRAAVHALRRTFSRFSGNGNNFSCILFIGGNYILNPALSIWMDDLEFERHWITGRRLEKEGNPDESIKEYTLAEGLYRGDYLEDDLYEEWTLQHREALKDIYLAILGKLAENSAQVADYESCISYCHKMLAKDPCCEKGYRWLMRSYSRLGRRSRALHWYRICEKTVRTNLDIALEGRTAALYYRLSQDEYI